MIRRAAAACFALVTLAAGVVVWSRVTWRARMPSAAFADIAAASVAAVTGDFHGAQEAVERVVAEGKACVDAGRRPCRVERDGMSLDFDEGRYAVDLLPVAGFSDRRRRVAMEDSGGISVLDDGAFAYVLQDEKASSVRSLELGK